MAERIVPLLALQVARVRFPAPARPRFRVEKAKRINSSREVVPGNAVVAGARQWRPQVNGRKNNNKSKLLGRAEFTRRPGA
jgi:hypothetical protein